MRTRSEKPTGKSDLTRRLSIRVTPKAHKVLKGVVNDMDTSIQDLATECIFKHIGREDLIPEATKRDAVPA
jgi:hypothetical protein